MNYLLRAAGDYCVDRRSVKAQQCVQPSLTNCPLTSFFKFFLEHIYTALLKHSPNNLVGVKKFVRSKRYQRNVGAFGGGVHLFPFRTEQLSPPAPMVLGQMSRESRSVPTQINKMPRCLRTAGHSCFRPIRWNVQFSGKLFPLICLSTLPYPFLKPAEIVLPHQYGRKRIQSAP